MLLLLLLTSTHTVKTTILHSHRHCHCHCHQQKLNIYQQHTAWITNTFSPANTINHIAIMLTKILSLLLLGSSPSSPSQLAYHHYCQHCEASVCHFHQRRRPDKILESASTQTTSQKQRLEKLSHAC